MKNLEFLPKYYPVLVRYRRSIASTLAGTGVLIVVSLLAPGPGSQTSVFVATSSFAAGETLTASDIAKKLVPDDISWETLVTDPNEIIGRVLAHPLVPNQPISRSNLVGSGLLDGLPKDFVAVSLPVSTSTSSALLTVGGTIDVYGSTNDDFNTGVLVASRAKILAIPKSSGGSMFSNGSTVSSIIVATDSIAAKNIAGSASSQGFTIALLP
jgi:Flp pilus assembly protein CpaB